MHKDVNEVMDIVHIIDHTYKMSLFTHFCQQLGPHHIRTKLYSVPLRVLNKLLEEAKASLHLDFSTPEYRLNAMIMDVAHHRLFKPPRITDSTPSESCSLS